MELLQGKTLLQKCGEKISEVSADEVLGSVDVVGLYFSAHWCPPCRMFTPVLAACYKELKENEKSFEVVFITMDQDDDQFRDYIKEMHGDWLAIPFDDSLKQALEEKYNVEGIPTLIIVKQNGDLIAENGRLDVSAKGALAFECWIQGLPAIANPDEYNEDSSEGEKEQEENDENEKEEPKEEEKE